MQHSWRSSFTIPSPCFNCERRKVTEDYNCHSDCPDYIDFKAKLDRVRGEKRVHNDISSSVIESIKRIKK